MTYYGSKELAEALRTVRRNTIRVAEDIPEEHYGYRATPETRSVGEALVHVAVATGLPEQVHFQERRRSMEGFDFPGFMAKISAEEKKPRSKAAILELLRENGERFAHHVEQATEDLLAETVAFPPAAGITHKTRFEMLLGSKEHEMHHRAQLMLIERMLGITPHLTQQMQQRMQAVQGSSAAR